MDQVFESKDRVLWMEKFFKKKRTGKNTEKNIRIVVSNLVKETGDMGRSSRTTCDERIGQDLLERQQCTSWDRHQETERETEDLCHHSSRVVDGNLRDIISIRENQISRELDSKIISNIQSSPSSPLFNLIWSRELCFFLIRLSCLFVPFLKYSRIVSRLLILIQLSENSSKEKVLRTNWFSLPYYRYSRTHDFYEWLEWDWNLLKKIDQSSFGNLRVASWQLMMRLRRKISWLI